MASGQLIRGYNLAVESVPCHPGSEEYVATAFLEQSIADVLPYLNRVLSSTDYYPEAPSLLGQIRGHAIAFWPDRIVIADVDGQKEANDLVGEIVALVNDTWARKEAIEPDHSARRRPAPMALYKLLPRTNCGQCGEETCYAFALKLAADQRQLHGCAPLNTDAYASERAALEALMAG
jgi:ArsR family metal-binding transcriptional regulator